MVEEERMMEMAILYSTGCPKCKVLAAKLDEVNVEYEIFSDVDKMIEIGIEEVPMLGIDNKLLGFKEAVEWINERN